MIGHTTAFKDYRTLSQSHIDFVVLVCHAIPALRADIALSNPKLTNSPDHFKQDRNSKSFIEGTIASYQDVLARTTIIASFSCFEAYIKDALIEIIEFHGGEDGMRRLARDRQPSL